MKLKELLIKIREFAKNNIEYLYFGVFGFFLLGMLYIFTYYFRDVVLDEAIYFHETFLISKLITSGEWIGNYATGLHGFLFKLPPALIFTVTGPSVFVVTAYNILLAFLVAISYYITVKDILGLKSRALLSTTMLVTSLYFLICTPTYLREMPSLLVVVFIIRGIHKKWKPWNMGVLFLLLLDAKEYLFFMFGVGYFFYIILKYFYKNKSGFISGLKGFVFESLLVYGPSIVYIILMFSTGLIPVNMFLASTIGLVTSKFSYFSNHFSTQISTTNLATIDSDQVKEIFQIIVNPDWSPISRGISKVINIGLRYLGKFHYPSIFSFNSIPRVIIVPSLIMSFQDIVDYFKKDRKRKINGFVAYSLLILVYIIVYLLRVSKGRYLLPISLLIYIQFVRSIFYDFEKRTSILISLVTGLSVVLGFFFEVSNILPKVILEITLLLLFSISTINPCSFFEKNKHHVRYFSLLVTAFVSLSVGFYFFVTERQVKYSSVLGYNREIEHIAQIMPENSKIWINEIQSYDTLRTFMGQTYSDPEWKWKLATWLPKTSKFKKFGDKCIYNDNFTDIELFRSFIYDNNIGYVIYTISETEVYTYPYEQKFGIVSSQSWLTEIEIYSLQGKKVHVFQVSE